VYTQKYIRLIKLIINVCMLCVCVCVSKMIQLRKKHKTNKSTRHSHTRTYTHTHTHTHTHTTHTHTHTPLCLHLTTSMIPHVTLTRYISTLSKRVCATSMRLQLMHTTYSPFSGKIKCTSTCVCVCVCVCMCVCVCVCVCDEREMREMCVRGCVRDIYMR